MGSEQIFVQPNVQSFWLPKRGNTAEEYEDACAFSDFHFAIADGATESSFAERWAQSLVKTFIAAPPPGQTAASVPLEQWLAPLQRDWHGGIAWDKLPWYAEEKARSGAFAAFLGVQFSPAPASRPKSGFFDFFRARKTEPELAWRAIAVGDSNFFQVRNEQLVRAFPLEHADQFNSRPLLLSSNPKKNQPVWQRMQVASGEGRPGDFFFLATDSLAQWFLAEHEKKRAPWKWLTALKSPDDFAELVEKLRSSTAARNDDMTLISWHWKDL